MFPKPRGKGRLLAFLIGLAFGGGGVLIASLAVKPILEYWGSDEWEKVEALVDTSEVEERGEASEVVITYDYEFQGQELRGERFEFGRGATNIGRAKMDELVKAYPSGEEIEVWVNPERPEKAVIFRQLSYQVWLSVLGMVPFLLVGCCAMAYAFWGRWVWNWGYEMKQELAKGAPEGIRKALEAERVREDEELLFTRSEKKMGGVTLIGGVLFAGPILMIFVIGMWEMLSSGDGLGYFFALFLIPFVFLAPRMRRFFRDGFFGNAVPAWVFLADGVCLGESGREGGDVTLQWMPSDDEGSWSDRACRVGVARWKSAQPFSKWKAQNPDWKKGLREMREGEAGSCVFQLDRIVEKSRFRDPTYDLYLLLVWQREDGVEDAHDFALQINDRD